MKSKRFDKFNWIDLGLQTLKQGDISDFTIDRLCEIAGKTKGSFYFHFQNMDDYLEALTKEWHKRFTFQITAPPFPKTKRTDLLNQLAGRVDLDLEAGIRNLACTQKTVRDIVTKADRERVEWLATLYRNSGEFSEEEAKALASIEIAAFTGFKLINSGLSPKEASTLYEHFLKLTGRT